MPSLTLGRRSLRGIPVGTLLGTSFGGVGTLAGVTETALATIAISPQDLQRNGEGLAVQINARTAANANTKQLRVRLGGLTGTVLFDSTALAANNEVWWIDLVLNRIAYNSQVAFSLGQRGSTVIAVARATAAIDLTKGTTLVVSGQNGTASANDLILDILRVRRDA